MYGVDAVWAGPSWLPGFLQQHPLTSCDIASYLKDAEGGGGAALIGMKAAQVGPHGVCLTGALCCTCMEEERRAKFWPPPKIVAF